MKHLKSMLALLLVFVMTLAMGSTTFAAAQTYSITVNNTKDSISMVGNTYSAYKLFDVTYSDANSDGTNDRYSYTVASEFDAFEYSYKNENDEDVTVKGEALIAYLAGLSDNAEALNTFAEAALKYVENNSIVAAGFVTAADKDAATINVDAPGYYLVAGKATAANNQTVVAACALTTTDPNAEVNVKADAPSIDKKITETDGTATSANTASIGDKVSFKITSKVPDMTGYEKYFFVINDTLSKGLTYNEDIQIKVGDTTLANTAYDLYSSIDTDGSNKLEIVFKNFIQYAKDAEIIVTYSATVNQNANLSPTDGNPNTATLTYSNNPNKKGTGTPENPDKPGTSDTAIIGETPESTTKTYVTGIKINKVDGNNTSKMLKGAKFSISGNSQKVVLVNKEMFEKVDNVSAGETAYYMLKDGTYTKDAAVTDKSSDQYNADKYDSTTQKYKKVTVVTKDTVSSPINAVGYTNESGVLTFEGLGTGSYTIKELVAPDGYNLLKDEITITIEDAANATGANWTVKKGDKSLEADGNNLYSLTVENNSGSELPSTGGMGTTIFYVLGGLMVLAAGVLLVTRKRMSKMN